MTPWRSEITMRQADVIKSLTAKLDQAKARIKFLEDRIESRGTDARFSVNEDLLAISQTIWKLCSELALLRTISKEVDKQ